MLLSTQQKYILESVRRLGCVRRGQLLILLRGTFQRPNFEISQARMDSMLGQLKTRVSEFRVEDDMVFLRGKLPDPLFLEAVDVMLELSEGVPVGFSAMQPPNLLWFTWGAGHLRLFTVAALQPGMAPEMLGNPGGRTVWLSAGGTPPQGLVLPPSHFFAARQEDGSHRFYGSTGP